MLKFSEQVDIMLRKKLFNFCQYPDISLEVLSILLSWRLGYWPPQIDGYLFLFLALTEPYQMVFQLYDVGCVSFKFISYRPLI